MEQPQCSGGEQNIQLGPDATKSRKGSKRIQGPKMNTPDFHTGVLYTPHVERTELASCAVCDAGIKEQTAYTAGDVRNDGRYHLKSCHGTTDIRYKTWTLSFKSMYWTDQLKYL